MRQLDRSGRPAAPRRGAVSAYAMGALLILLLTGLAVMQLGLQATRAATVQHEDNQARSLAQAAVDQCLWMMEQSPDGAERINAILNTGGRFGPTQPRVCPQGRFWFEAWKPCLAADGSAVAGAAGVRAYGQTPRGTQECVQVVAMTGGGNAGVFDHVLFSDSTLYFQNYCLVNGCRSWAGEMTATPNNRVVSASANWATNAFTGMTLRVMSGAATGRTYVISSNTPNQLLLKEGDPGNDGARKGDAFWVINSGKGVYANGLVTFGAPTTLIGGFATTSTVDQRDKCTQPPPGAPFTEHAPRQQMPEIDIAGYRRTAIDSGTYRSGSYTTASITFRGTRTQPEVLFVEGSLYLTNASYSGYGVIVSPTSVHIQDKFALSGGTGGLAVLCSGPVYFQGQTTVSGLVYAHSSTGTGAVYLQDAAQVKGAVVADRITIQNKLTIDYDPALRQLGGLPGSGQGPVRIVSWEDA